MSELEYLRRRVKSQRRELRRLNKEISSPKAAYWFGFRRGLDANAAAELRGKMNRAFGQMAVWEAEFGAPETLLSNTRCPMCKQQGKHHGSMYECTNHECRVADYYALMPAA